MRIRLDRCRKGFLGSECIIIGLELELAWSFCVAFMDGLILIRAAWHVYTNMAGKQGDLQLQLALEHEKSV